MLLKLVDGFGVIVLLFCIYLKHSTIKRLNLFGKYLSMSLNIFLQHEVFNVALHCLDES